MLMNHLGPFYIKYLILLILGVVPFASAQDTKLPPDVRLSEGSKLDKSQAGYYRMKIGMIDVIALTDGTIGVDFLALLTNTKPGEVESLLAREYVKPTAVEASMNAYLIQLDHKLILIDTGAGELLGPKLDKLPDSLFCPQDRLRPGPTQHRSRTWYYLEKETSSDANHAGKG